MDLWALIAILVGLGCIWLGFTGNYAALWQFLGGTPVAVAPLAAGTGGPATTTPGGGAATTTIAVGAAQHAAGGP